MLYLATDHRGFALKERVKRYLLDSGIEFEDLGAFEYLQTDDFPDYAEKLAGKVKELKENLGIAICGSGAGMSITLNKFDGIRAGLAENPEMAEAMKKDDDINILVIPADFVSEHNAYLMIDKFMSAVQKTEEKYKRRLNKIKKIEESN